MSSISGFRPTVTGNLGRDPELRSSRDGVYASASLAWTPRRRDERGQWVDAGDTIWFDLVAFGPMIDLLCSVPGGSRVTVSGRGDRREFVRRDGSAGSSLRIVVELLGVHERRERNGATPAADPAVASVRADLQAQGLASAAGMSDGWGAEGLSW